MYTQKQKIVNCSFQQEVHLVIIFPDYLVCWNLRNRLLALPDESILCSFTKSEYDQETPQSHTADQTMAPWGEATGHLQ